MLQITTLGWFLSPRDQLADRPGGAPRWVVASTVSVGEGVACARPKSAAATPRFRPTAGRLVDHDDAVPVGVVEHLLGVGVVRSAERVRADPREQLEVVHHVRVVVALAGHARVLVLAEAGEVERLAVDAGTVPSTRRCGCRPAASTGRRPSPLTSSTVSSWRYPRPGRHSSASSTRTSPSARCPRDHAARRRRGA